MKEVISTAGLEREFRRLLDDPINRRIILSGVFGIGKTTFIKNFFAKHSEEFVCIKVFPVNYSVAVNEDIFELIKYDILYELLQANPRFERVDVKWFETLYFVSFDDIKQVIGKFVALIPKVGKHISEVGTALSETVKVFERKRRTLVKNDLSDVLSFARQVEKNLGGIYENDFYTRLIESLIRSLKISDEGDTGKNVVLVIDDLDRIDPDHIFRILNVFAAHFDHNATENKFGVDKVVLSCDIENVRQIFHARYGATVDFNGYIDKFFSKGIFYFNNKLNFMTSLPLILETVESVYSNFLFKQEKHYLKSLLYIMLKGFINAGCLNLRMVMKFLNVKYDSLPRKVITAKNNSAFTIRNFRIMLLFEFLIDLFGSLESLILAIDRIEFELSFEGVDEKRMMGDLLYISTWSGIVYDGFSEKIRIRIVNKETMISVKYETQPDKTNSFSALYLPTENGSIPTGEQKRVLIDAIKMYKLITFDD